MAPGFSIYFTIIILTFTSFQQITRSNQSSDSVCRINSVPHYFIAKNQTQKHQEQLLFVQHILTLFRQDSIHNRNFILVGNSFGRTGESVRNLINQLFLDDYKRPVVSIITSEGNTNHIFHNVLSSCILNNDTDTFHTNVFIIQPETTEETEEIMSHISSFYDKNPSKSSTIYFFLAWIWTTTVNPDLNRQQPLSHFSIRRTVMKVVKKVPLHSHFYILFHNNLPQNRFHKNTWTICEFYGVNRKYFLEPIVASSTSEFLNENINRRKDFKGTSIRAIAMIDNFLPILTVFETVNGTDVFKGGKALDLLEPMSKSLNAKLEIIQGTGWIKLNSNGTVEGMASQLINEEADLTLSFSELLCDRIRYLDASHPSAVFKVNAYFQAPLPGLYRDIFIEAFSPTLWAIIAASWLVILTFLIGFGILKRKYSDDCYSESDTMIFQEAISWALGIACQQGWSYSPTSVSLQIIVLCGLFSSLLYYTAYSASIISIFSVEINRFSKLSDLLDHGFKLYGTDSSWTGQNDVKAQAEKDGVTFSSRIVNATLALEKIRTSRTALIASQRLFFPHAILQNNTRESFCKYLSTPTHHVAYQYLVIYFKKYDALKKYIDLQLTRWKETGLGYRWNLDHNRALPLPCEPKRKEPLPLELQDVRTAFILLVIGFVLCLMILGYEILFHDNRRKRGKEDKGTQTWIKDTISFGLDWKCASKRPRSA